jgi:hypothetical protein
MLGALFLLLGSALVDPSTLLGQASAPDSITPPRPDSASAAPRADRLEAARDVTLQTVPGAASGAADSGAVAKLRAGTSVRRIGQAGDWVRVQVEGWVPGAELRAARGAALVGVTAAEVRATPDHYVGQTVDWRVQVISVQAADDLRSEMLLGQPYLLARGPLPETGFIYITLTEDEAQQMRARPPLAELLLRVTIRAARTRYLETPVADFVAVVAGGQARKP